MWVDEQYRIFRRGEDTKRVPLPYTDEDEMVQMTAAEITAYTAGFDNNEQFGDKIYFTEDDEDGEHVEVEMKIDTSFKFDFEIRQDLLGSL